MIVVKQVCDICKKEIEGQHYEVYFNGDSKDFVDTDVVSENYDFCPDCMAKLLKPYEDILEDEPELKIYIPKRKAAGYVDMTGARGDIPQQKEVPPMPDNSPSNATCSSSSEFDVTCYSESDEGSDTVSVEGSITGGSDVSEIESDISDNENVTSDNKNDNENDSFDSRYEKALAQARAIEPPGGLNVLPLGFVPDKSMTEHEEEDNTAQEITDNLFSDEKFVKGISSNNSKGYPAPRRKRGRPKRNL